MLARNEPYPTGASFAEAHAARLHTVVHAGVRLAEAYGERPAGARSIFFVKAADEGAPPAASSSSMAITPAALHELLASPEAMREAGYPEGEIESAPAATAAADDEPPPRLFALDCEMVQVSDGSSALARLSLVDEHEAVLLDALVLPQLPIVDYRTRWSGLDADALKGATLDAAAARGLVRALVRPCDVLIGHSLENDLRALGLAHARVIDTALVFPHPLGGGRKRKLAHLSSELLAQTIQRAGDASGDGGARVGHDSIEDARACMRLVRARLRDRAFGARRRSQFTTLCEILQAADVPCAALDDAARARARVLALRDDAAAVPLETPSALAFTWCAGAHAVGDVDDILSACPANTLLIALAPAEEPVAACGADAGEARPSQARACALTLAVIVPAATAAEAMTHESRR
jgi:DNA polymerase III epsilon subunit-like protein